MILRFSVGFDNFGCPIRSPTEIYYFFIAFKAVPFISIIDFSEVLSTKLFGYT
ncbi:hypothetical protein [Emticicia aquatilis]|uniref:hypothetical protein n=1 Tax=Emticicia aquatilis TaxID=1537369 RepID=UPI001664ED55|nr:hypothetical protein [Emticicia aquatilis]